MEKKKRLISDKTKLLFMGVLALFVALTMVFYGWSVYNNGNLNESLGIFAIGIIILSLTLLFLIKNYNELKQGFPLHDERSGKVMTVASSKAFYLSIWLLLIISYLSDGTIEFRDVSQALNISIGGMAILFALCWIFVDKFVKNLDKCY